MIKIADFLNVSIDYLLGRNDDPSPLKCITEKSKEYSILCNKDLLKAYEIGGNEFRIGVPCSLDNSIAIRPLLSKYRNDGYLMAHIGCAYAQGWIAVASKLTM